MGLIDNLIGAVLLLSLVIISTLIIAINANQDMIADLNFKRMSNIQEKHQMSLNTLMALTEPTSGQSYGRLLSRSLVNRDDVIMIGDNAFNVTRKINRGLDIVYGPDNWYYEVFPVISDIRIVFVLDGTSSIDNEREILEENIGMIISSVNDSLHITFGDSVPSLAFRVYITTEDDHKCAYFNSLVIEGFEGCFNVRKSDMYADYDGIVYPMPSSVMGGSIGNTFYNEDTLYRGDWMGGLVYATNDTIGLLSDPDDSIVIMFPMTDEMTTGSVPNECYSQGEPLYSGSSDEELYEGIVNINAGICAFCLEECPNTRSEHQFEAGMEILSSLQSGLSHYRVLGVFSLDCETEYGLSWNDITTADIFNYINDNFGTDRPSDGSNWCELDSCRGCDSSPDDNTMICWRSSCVDDTIEQLRLLSEGYVKDIIYLDVIEDIPTEIVYNVRSIISGQARTGGVRRDDAERYVVSYELLLPGNIIFPYMVWVYEDRVFDESLPELRSIEVIPDSVYSGQQPTVRMEVFDSSGISTVRVFVEGEEYILIVNNGYYEAVIDTLGFEEGYYDIEYVIVDILGNTLEGTETDAFEVDNSLAPEPEDVVLVFNRESYVIEHDAIATLTFDSVVDISSVTIIITDEDGNTIHILLMNPTSPSYYQYAQSFNVLHETGVFYGTIIITDVLGREHVHNNIRSYEVIDTIPCDSNANCLAVTGMDYCVGVEKDNYYCSSTRAGEGEYTTEKDNCQLGLAYDTTTTECYNPQGIYHIALLPFRFADNNNGRNEFLNFANRGIDRIMQDSPLSDCDPDKLDDSVRFLISQDMNCVRNRGQCNTLLMTNTNTIINCMKSMRDCAREEFGPIVDEWHVLSRNNDGWEFQGVAHLGHRTSLTSLYYYNRPGFNHIDYDINVLLHEIGHGWNLSHIDISNIGSQPANACQPPNAADCQKDDDVKKFFYMNYYNILNKRYGTAGYNYIKTNRDAGLGEVMEICV
ncbi:MAG: hypothetical protein ACMXYL_05120 [Candidatus Woesearchaeota archaeon]